jgi:transglycosylase-like protein with SLT domain
MTPPWRVRALIWVRLALVSAVAGTAVIAGSTPDPVSDVEARVHLTASAPPTPQPAAPDDRLARWRPRPPSTTTPPPTTTTTRPPPPPRRPPPAPRRPTTTIARPTTTVASSGLPAAVERWRSLVAAYSDWPVNLMLSIMWCESKGDPNAQNRSGAAGLFQHLPPPPGWRDPKTNTDAAHSKWATRGTQPWSASRHCWG